VSKPELDNLARIGKLATEAPSSREFAGLLASGQARLADARREANSLPGRFDLAYNAAHAFALAALRWHGYRSDNRYPVFQSLPHTLGVANAALAGVIQSARNAQPGRISNMKAIWILASSF
jgi:hypothetical protein